MASITKRTIILVICRIANYGVLMLSPIFLVRILDMRVYGQYREFILYAMLLSTIVDFATRNSLIYFIPKYPDLEKKIVTQTALFLLVTTTVGVTVVYIARHLILARTSYDFIAYLMLYIFFFLNLDFYESFWLGKKRSQNVLFFSTGRATIRMVAIIIAAYATREVIPIIKILILVESAKCTLMLFLFRRYFTRHLDWKLMMEQLRYIVPLGFSANINYLNNQLARLIISVRVGVETLALYTIGSYQIPIISILRSSIMDVLFPEMSQRGNAERMRLWKRANVLLCFIFFPVFIVFFYHAETFIETLFTKDYSAAVPLFRVYLFLMIRQCFELGTPLRAMNKNKFFIIGTIIHLAVNITLIYLFFERFDIIALPAAFVLGDFCMALYLTATILKQYRLRISELIMWKSVFAIVSACCIALPFLFLGGLFDFNPIVEAIVFSLLFFLVYLAFMRKRRIDDVNLLIDKAIKRVRRK